jgi:hypothetical protein
MLTFREHTRTVLTAIIGAAAKQFAHDKALR